jgi:hypothetical protein
MSVMYEFKIKKWNHNIDLQQVAENYDAKRMYGLHDNSGSLECIDKYDKSETPMLYTDKDCRCNERLVQIPYTRGYEFEQKLKQFADVEYQITGVLDVPVDEDNMVIDGTHKDFNKDDWK